PPTAPTPSLGTECSARFHARRDERRIIVTHEGIDDITPHALQLSVVATRNARGLHSRSSHPRRGSEGARAIRCSGDLITMTIRHCTVLSSKSLELMLCHA